MLTKPTITCQLSVYAYINSEKRPIYITLKIKLDTYICMYIHVHYKAMKFGFIMLYDKHVFLLQMVSWNGKQDKENVNKQ